MTMVHHRHYRSRREAMEDIAEFIEILYNRQRLQAGLGYLSPAAYAPKYYAGLMVSIIDIRPQFFNRTFVQIERAAGGDKWGEIKMNNRLERETTQKPRS